jgi:hypothetical protein
MHTEKANKPGPVVAIIITTVLLATAVMTTTTDNAFAYKKNHFND